MAKSGSSSNPGSVDALLHDRQQLEEWIERLDLASDETPPEVRQRVREDYDKRLTEVLAELNNFADELSETLKTEVKTREELWGEEREARNRFAEAQLRHTVGEYTDKQWQEIQAEVDEVLGRVGAALENATAEISRLEDVLGAMKPAPQTSQAVPEDEESSETQPPQAESAAGDSPEEGEKPQVDAFDSEDMTFIKSTKTTAEGDRAQAATAHKDEGETSPEESGKAEHVEEYVPRPSTIGVEIAMPKAEKTLKCSECGEMNFPTEWYCEHCGAELASL